MKIFIIYASAGAGHRKAAEAIFNCFKTRSPSDDIRLIDVLEKTNSFYRKTYASGYEFLVHHATWLWSWLFNLTSSKYLKGLTSLAIKYIDIINARNFSNFIIREQPNIVISTHFMPPEVLTWLKKKSKIRCRLVTVITDFGVHPLWISEGTDTYIVASALSKDHLVKQGIKPDSIFDFGIPIDAKFSLSQDKIALRRKLGLLENKFTLLITTGSFGIGPVEKIISGLCQEMQIIVVCAKNEKLYALLKNKNYPHTLILGFVDNIHVLMACADIVIAKPGGLTTSELLSMEIVPVFISPIPGQETHNLAAMQEFGIGKYARGFEEIKSTVLDYKNNPEKINAEIQTIRKVKKPLAAESLYNAIR